MYHNTPINGNKEIYSLLILGNINIFVIIRSCKLNFNICFENLLLFCNFISHCDILIVIFSPVFLYQLIKFCYISSCLMSKVVCICMYSFKIENAKNMCQISLYLLIKFIKCM